MSGDVQPRKRKDKKKKKDEFTGPPAEERPAHIHVPASSHSSSEGVVIMHAQHDHGTGGHWCAKIVFFILLGILVGLIGLIILENRGLSDLDTPNSESRYAAVFDGWVDEALPNDHHHDEHTFELTHPDDDDDHDNADEGHEVSEEHGSEEQQDERSDEKDEDSNDEETDENSEEQDNEDLDEDADEDSEREEEHSEEENNDVSEEDQDNAVSEEQEDNSEEQADDQSQEQVDQISDEQDDEESDASKEKDNEASNERDDADSNEDIITDSNEQDNEDSNEEVNAASDEQNNDNSAENNENSAEQSDNSAEENDDNSAEQNEDASEERDVKEESNEEQDDDNEDSDQEKEEQDGGEQSDQENDVELEDIVKETDTQQTSQGQNEKDDSDNEGWNESDNDDMQYFSEMEEQVSDYVKEDLQEEFLEDEVEQEGGGAVRDDDKPYEELDSAEEVVVDNAAGEQEYEERKAKEQKAAEEETSNLGVKFGVGVALVAVAHAVLVRKWRNAREQPASGERPERRLTLMEDSLLLGADSQSSQKETSGKKVLFSPTTTEHEANSEESEAEEEEEVQYEPPIKTASSFFAKPQPPVVHRAPEEEEDDDIMQVEEFSKKIGFAESQSPPPVPPPKNLPTEKKEEIEISEDEISEDEMPGDVEVISDDEVENENNKVEKQGEDEAAPENEIEAGDEDEDLPEEEEDEVEEVEEDEDISDVDDVELMKRLEMKYGKLPDEDPTPEPSRKRKSEGGLSVETWADEPADNQWRQQLDLAQAELDEGKIDEARDTYLRVLRVAPESTRALWGYARSLDLMAEQKRSNEILNAAIAAYNNLLNLGPALSDKLFEEVANRTINRIRFKGNALLAEPVHKLLIKRFDAEPKHRNDLAISYLMTNNPHKARLVLKETLERWPNDGVALVHYGFILKTVDNKLEEAVTYLQHGINTGDQGTLDGRFFFQLGDALLMLGRKKEADEVHRTGSLKGIFLSPEQRSLYNVDRLLGMPWWRVEQTPYINLVNDLEKHWREILSEALSLANEYGPEREGLKSKGLWTQLDLFTRGREIPGRCKKAPVTCAIVKKEPNANNCRRGQIKFSALTPGTHIRPHVGPTNCRLRAHLGLTNTEGAYLRVHNETRTWKEGKVFIFDDSFEHEVWHNGTGTRIVLIVDLWHPQLTAHERSTLPAI